MNTNSFVCIIGVVSEDHVPKYAEYKARLRALAEGAASGTPFSKTTILELEETHGLGFAVRAALEYVHTPYVVIVQVWDDGAFLCTYVAQIPFTLCKACRCVTTVCPA